MQDETNEHVLKSEFHGIFNLPKMLKKQEEDTQGEL
jgi:hypothetical protein